VPILNYSLQYFSGAKTQKIFTLQKKTFEWQLVQNTELKVGRSLSKSFRFYVFHRFCEWTLSEITKKVLKLLHTQY